MKRGKSTVYRADFRATTQRTIFHKLDDLLLKTGLPAKFKKGHLVAIKLHFGERGNTAYIRPVFVRHIVEMIRQTGAHPFLTDTNTLYVGDRTNSAAHIERAILNGFDFAVTGAPIIIADGLRGESAVKIEIDGRHLSEVSIAREIASADGLVVLSHFKCHELTGFGGALKNVGMGCASREGKLAQHSQCAPKVSPEKCTACGECALYCPANAISVEGSAVIDGKLCTGCSHCIAVCPEGTIKVQWNESASNVQEKMVEHLKGALRGKEGRTLYVNFINQVTPLCDCYGHSDTPIVPDVGILASTDPVAIDQASVDLVNAQEGFRNSALTSGHAPGCDKFRGVHPVIDWEVQLDYAEVLGLGSREYRIEGV
jgi:uncharacterized Fe-S center protein